MKTEAYLALDVGGTFIKRACLTRAFEFVSEPEADHIDSNASKEEILDAFATSIGRGLTRIEEAEMDFAGLCCSICGPLDYPNGIPLMNEDKYTSIYGVDLKAEFRNMLHEGRRCAPIEFLHDVQSFLAGLAALDPSFRSGKILAITLGTGIGCALLRDGAIVPYGPDFIDKAVGRQPWGAGKLEDLIGGKALLRRFKERENAKPVSSVKEIALLAKDGDATALAHFEEFGEILGEAMRPLLRKLAVDALVFGGQIANSYELLETAFLAALGAERPKRIFRAAEMERAALAGAVYLAFNPKG